jgi:Tol biopolymer transport system component
LTSDGGVNPGPSPDGQWVVYEVQKGSQWTIRKVPMQGGAPVHLATGSNAAVSADGKWLAYEFNDPQTRQERIGIMPFNGGESVKVLDVKAGPGRIRWARDSRALAFIQQGGREIFVQPVFGGGGRSILKVEGDPLLAFDISRDGKQIAYTVGRVTSDLIVFSRPGGL